MKVSSSPRSLNDGDVLYVAGRFFEAKSTSVYAACGRCSLRNENCYAYIGDFCPSTRYYRFVRITPEIERALDIALLQGEVFTKEV